MTAGVALPPSKLKATPHLHPYRRYCQQMNPAAYTDLLVVSTDMQPDGIAWHDLYQVQAYVCLDAQTSTSYMRVCRFDRLRGIGMGAIGVSIIGSVVVMIIKLVEVSRLISQADLVAIIVGLGMLLVTARWYLQESYSVLLAMALARRYRHLLERDHCSLF